MREILLVGNPNVGKSIMNGMMDKMPLINISKNHPKKI